MNEENWKKNKMKWRDQSKLIMYNLINNYLIVKYF